ncbi:phosphopantetheine-binding protein [Amycolatopsis sp. NPDC051071]|uniref:acyl carrier protein n=1 Tax=Amycolatopsis sp. NPDC051071 TaxID=3154637 RepID=UPI0034380E4F
MTEMDDTASVVLNTLSEVLNKSTGELRARPVLATHGWDSLASLEVLSRLESGLTVTLDLRAYHAAHTVTALIDLVAAAATSNAAAGRRG